MVGAIAAVNAQGAFTDRSQQDYQARRGLGMACSNMGGMMGSMMGTGGMGMMGSGYGSMMGGGMTGNSYGNMQSMMGQHTQFCGQMMSNTTRAGYMPNHIVIVNYAFTPQNLTVKKGTTVTWINMDFVQHTVTSGSNGTPNGLFDSALLDHMQTFSYTFNEPGEYRYFCKPHPNMTGTVIVEP